MAPASRASFFCPCAVGHRLRAMGGRRPASPRRFNRGRGRPGCYVIAGCAHGSANGSRGQKTLQHSWHEWFWDGFWLQTRMPIRKRPYCCLAQDGQAPFLPELQDNGCRNDHDCSEGDHGGTTGVGAEGLGCVFSMFVVSAGLFNNDVRGDVLAVDSPVAVPVYESHSRLLSTVIAYGRLLSRLYNWTKGRFMECESNCTQA